MLACLLATAAPVRAQPVPEPAAPLAPEAARPWAAGVSEADQALALELYTAGNRDFIESRLAESLAKYKEALRHWDHPAIRFNMAVWFINFDQPLEARDNLERSLAYGAAALSNEAYAQAITYRKLLDAQIARITVACRQPGAAVVLDGKPLFTAPGEANAFVLPGEHLVVVTKPGLSTVSKALSLVAGQRMTYDVRALERPATTQVARRWTAWKPWGVLGGAAVAAAIGALTLRAATDSFAAVDRSITDHCPPPNGCTAEMVAQIPGLDHTRDVAERENLVGLSLLSIGGAGVLAGVIGLVLNQPRVVNLGSPVVTLTPGGATVTMQGRFW